MLVRVGLLARASDLGAEYGRDVSRITPHNFHRLALAVEDRTATSEWLGRVLGAKGVAGSRELTEPGAERDAGNLAGTDTEILWVGGYPVILLSGGVVGRFLQRFGPGVQSWAWEIDDNWSAEHFLRDRDIEIVSVNVGGRFFFMHPRHTHGLLWEWCDGKMPRDPEFTTPDPGLVGNTGMAWTTGVVSDADEAAAWIMEICDAEVVEGNQKAPSEVEQTVDLQVGDIVVRLVTPQSDDSRYAHDLSQRGPHVHSFAVRVADLAVAEAALASEGAGVSYRHDGLLATDPSGTLGLKIDWVA